MMREGETGREEGGEITRLLAASASGSAEARDRLVELVFAELHQLARGQMAGERPGHTLGATVLVNEVYLKLFKPEGIGAGGARGAGGAGGPGGAAGDGAAKEAGDGGIGAVHPWADRHAFFGAAVMAMRRILVDHARSRLAAKRGGGARRAIPDFDADAVSAAQTLDPSEFLSLDEAIGRLEEVDPRAAQITRLRFFAGMSLEVAAELAGVSTRTAIRDWNFARAWLLDFLGGEGAS